jgi:hypothetical protein
MPQISIMRRLRNSIDIFGRLLKGMASLSCFILLVILVAAVKILALKFGSFIDLASLLCLPACLVCLPALSACLPSQPACLVLVSWSVPLLALLLNLIFC